MNVLTQPVTESLLTHAVRSSRKWFGKRSDNLKYFILLLQTAYYFQYIIIQYIDNIYYVNALFLMRILAIAAAK